ncbi:O-antigen ligase family protein [[Erwinia] mediterraneensis]|uniref:O-antigen ligase family protein n=1 Tax=[Erwinia] mediterraneensis TaxID=2161819 RepID=UPI0010324B71|nr:O-antigen ligase family protein [[Erwinia] mediterraneensis]
MLISLPGNVTTRKALAFLALATAFCILPAAFVHEKTARVIFYWFSYISIVGLLLEFRNYKSYLQSSKIPLAFLLLGCVYLGWSVYAQMHTTVKHEMLFTAGKRMILAFLTLSYLLCILQANYFSRSTLRKLALASMGAAFISSGVYAFIQGATSTERIVLGINRATMTAYAYSAFTLALLTLVVNLSHQRFYRVLFLIMAPLSLYVIFLTQTRAAMAIHTLLLAVLTLRLFFLSRNFKVIAGIAIALTICLGLSYKTIEKRVELTVNEFESYQKNNDHTSLGSRFTMWSSGILAFENAPFGQTQEQRNAFIVSWLKEHGNSNSYAITFLNVHLHNEFIQYASIFGVGGVVILLFFFWVHIVDAARKYAFFNPVTIAALSTLLYGMTDVLLTSIEYIVIFSVIVSLTQIILAEKIRKDVNHQPTGGV